MPTDDINRWNRIYDKIEHMNEKIGETNVEMAKISTAMASHVESDTECFNRIDQNFRDLSNQINEVCLSKKDAKKEAGKSGAIFGGVVAVITALITACATIVARGM